MNVVRKTISEITSQLSALLKTGIYDFCDIETAIDEHTLLMKDGALVTSYQVLGTTSIVGNIEHGRIVDELSNLQSNIEEPGYAIQICFTRSMDDSGNEVDTFIDGMRFSQKRHGLDLDAVIDEKESLLKASFSKEFCTISLMTSPKVLNKTVLRSEQKAMIKHKAQYKINTGLMGQGIDQFCHSLLKHHDTFCGVFEKLAKGNIEIHKCKAKKSLKLLKQEIDAADYDGFEPIVIGDTLPISLNPELTFDDTTHINYPAMAYQLFSWPINLLSESNQGDPSIIQYGRNYIAPMIVDQPPTEIKPFSKLFSAIDKNIPYRLSIRLSSGHDAITSAIKVQQIISTALLVTSQKNREISEGADHILQKISKEGDILVKTNIAMATWGNSVESAQVNRLALKQALVTWGKPNVIIEKGDVVDIWAETLPSFFTKSCASASFPLPFHAAMALLPLFRQANPFKTGHRMMKSIDDKMVPLANFSSKQQCWIELMAGRAGSGKSVFFNDSLASQIYFAGNENLPYQAILDVNPSSQYYIEYIKSILPDTKKHLADFVIVENSHRYAINILDTKLGFKKPTGSDKSFITLILTQLLTPTESRETTKHLPAFVSQLVDSAYHYYDKVNPKLYSENIDTRVDQAISRSSITLDTDPTWWEVVDALFDAGLVEAAILAQRHAVPTLNDLSEVISSDSSLQGNYEDAIAEQEKLISVVYRSIQNAVRAYPALSVPSKISIDRARIVSVNLKKVSGSTEEEEKRASLFYLCFMHVLTARFFIDDEILQSAPLRYKKYYKSLMKEIESSPKTVAFDEFSKANKHKVVEDFCATLARESRKFKVGLKFASQFLHDYPKVLRDSATSVYIFDSQSELDSKNKMQKDFGYNDDVRHLLDREVKGPSSQGVNFLMRIDIKGKDPAWHVCRFKLGPIELWAYGSSKESTMVRKEIVQRLGNAKAYQILSSMYPNGSIQDEYEALKMQSDEISDDNLINVIIDKILASAKYAWNATPIDK